MLDIAPVSVNLACVSGRLFVQSRAQLIPTCAPCYRVAKALPLESGG